MGILENVRSIYNLFVYTQLFFLLASDATADSKEKPLELPASNLQDFSWTIKLSIKNTLNNSVTTCGGAIIKKNVITSAAHCFNKPASRYKVEAIFPEIGNRSEVRVEVKYLIIHPKFNRHSKLHDIALLITKSSLLQAKNDVELLKLPPIGYKAPVDLSVISYGTTSILHTFDVFSASESECTEILHQNNISLTLSGQFCAQEIYNRIYKGYSGSPVISRKDKVFCGIISYGFEKYLRLPDIYTNVSFYLEWINSALLLAGVR